MTVLRNGVRDRGSKFDLAYFMPATGLNPEYQRKYEANRFTVVRQLRYSETSSKSLDLTIFLNGLPIFTEVLSKIVREINERFGTDFMTEDKCASWWSSWMPT